MKKYKKPKCDIFKLDCVHFLSSSNSQIDVKVGTTKDNPAPLKRLLPIFVNYDELEPDIKENLKKGNYVVNFRVLEMMNIEYTFIVGTYRNEDNTCICFYCQCLSSLGYLMYYNIYEILESFLMQIREKVNGVYKYHISAEVRKKMPTFCKLLANADANDKAPKYGLPMITFLDSERKYPLLSAGFKYESVKDETFDKIHEAFFKILEQIYKETADAGLLNQSIKTLFKNSLKILLLSRHLFFIP